MSTASKITLASTTLSAVGIVIFVHYAQEQDRSLMHQGVLMDMERQRVKRERQADFDLQKQTEEEYRKIQNVRPDTSNEQPAG